MKEFKYNKKLAKEIDKEIIADLITAYEEKRALQRRLDLIEKFIDDNEEMAKYLWTTGYGKTVSLFDVDESHLINIRAMVANNEYLHGYETLEIVDEVMAMREIDEYNLLN
jgi:N-acetylglutamate synthase-like GNAT family acetyltransferase